MAKTQLQAIFHDHQLAHRYLDGHQGIEIGGASNNQFHIAGCRNVDYAAESRFKDIERELAGDVLPVDIVAEMDDLPLEDSSQDYVLSSHALEHSPNAVKTIHEWIRVIKPGGIIFLILPHIDGQGTHPADNGKEPTTLEEFQADFDCGHTAETHPIPEGHEQRGHYYRWTHHSLKAFFRHFFPDTLKIIDGEPMDSKVGNGQTIVLRVTKPTLDGSPRIDVLPTRVRVWVNLPDETGCTAYRQAYPMMHCKEALRAQGIDVYAGGEKGGMRPDSSYDLYILQRAPNPACYMLFHWLLKSNRRLAWDLDDDFNSIPKWSPAYEGVRREGNLAALPCYLDMAHVITTTVPHLAAKIEADYHFAKGKTVILPNLIDPAKYRRKPSALGRRPRIMWTGSGFHGADIDLLVPVVHRIVDETDWDVVFMGAIPDGVTHLPENRVWGLGGAQIRYYPRLLCELATDVALIPLTGTLFDRSKSAIKWMECSMSGAAVVATNFGPYADAIVHGETGIFVQDPTDPDEWMIAIRRALLDRERLVANAIPEVIAEHSWDSPACKQKWVDFYVEQCRLSIEYQRANDLIL